MESFIKDLILSNSNSLLVSDGFSLRENVKALEERCKREFAEENEDELFPFLWIKLVDTSLKNQNLKLALLIIAKLKLTQLALILKSTLNSTQSDISHLLTFVYIASHFQMTEHVSKFLDLLRRAQQKIDLDLDKQKELSYLYINSNQWDEAFRWSDTISHDDNEELLNQQVLSYKLAIQYEIDEEYSQALVYFEKSTTIENNLPRVIIKQFNKSALHELKKYCTSHENLHKFLNDYSSYCDILNTDLHSLHDDTSHLTSLKIMSLKLEAKEIEKRILLSVPNQMRDFILDTSCDKWLNKQKLESMLSMGAILSSSLYRVQIAALASSYYNVNCIRKASSIYLLLNQHELASNMVAQDLETCSGMQLITQFTQPSRLLAHTIDFFHRKQSSKSKNKSTYIKSKSSRAIFHACLKLGLINEALIAFAQDPHKDEKVLSTAINLIESSIEERYTRSLDNINPILPKQTFKILSILLQERDKIIATHVINIIILSLTITLYKFNTNSIEHTQIFIPHLEIMFSNLSDYFQTSKFHASNGLIRAMNNLITVVKDKLDALSDSDIIRNAFKQIVDSTANRCMIESQYKSAAMLYSKLEDNVSAVKALMRLGEIDIVINYSLLVRDLTVNRITINYLKHLKVDLSVIEDFITRTKVS